MIRGLRAALAASVLASVGGVVEAGLKREANEADKRKRFAAGELGLDIYNMRERLAEKGLRYVDSEPDG